MLEIPSRGNLRREADHVCLEGDVDNDRIVLMLYRLEELGHDWPDGFTCALEGLIHFLGVRRVRDSECVRDLGGNVGDLDV